MRLLATIYPTDVDPSVKAEAYDTYRPRLAARAIIFDGTAVALIYLKNEAYYMLPGGGIDKDEAIQKALQREIAEETGHVATIGPEVGTIITYFDRWRNKQTDICFIAHKKGSARAPVLTDFETDAGFATVWAADLTAAIKLVGSAAPSANDAKLVQARDLLFLQAMQKQLYSVS